MKGAMDAVTGATLRGICSSYFENHVSPVLRYIQQAQEQLNSQLQELKTTLASKGDITEAQQQLDTQLQELRTTLARKADIGEASKAVEGDKNDNSGIVSSRRHQYGGKAPPDREGQGGVSTLIRLQDLTAAVKTKADASSVPTLAQFHKLEATVNQKFNTKDFPAELTRRLADQGVEKTTLKQLQDVEQKVEELAASVRVSSRDAPTEPTSPTWERLDMCTTPSTVHEPSTLEAKDTAGTDPSIQQLVDLVERVDSQVQELATAMDEKANTKDIPTEVRVLCAELVQTGDTAATNPSILGLVDLVQRVDSQVQELVSAMDQKANTKDIATEVRMVCSELVQAKPDLKKVQLAIAAAAMRYDKQLKELRVQVHTLSEELKCSKSVQDEANADLANRWPGRQLSADSDGFDDNKSETGSIAASYTGSVADSVISGLTPEDKAELRRIQAIVVAAGTAFSKELREVRRQTRELRDEMSHVKDHLGIKNGGAG